MSAQAQALLADLGLDALPRFGPGRRAAPLRVAYAGELTVEDLVAARSSTLVQTVPPLKALRQSHHQLARVLAQGTANEEAAIICGMSPSRISSLRSDPAFSELLAYYQAMETEQYGVARADMHERLASLGFDAVETLHEKLLEDPEGFDNKTLLAIVEATSDRTGHGKTSTVQHDHTHSLSPEAIAKIKSSVAGRQPLAETDRQSLLGIAARQTTGQLPEGVIEGDWSESGGTPVREEGEEGTGEPLAG
jgi:hypothetical protein